MNSEAARLFFALWPDAELQAALYEAGSQLHRRCGGRRTRCENIHLTLAFLGAVDPARMQGIADVADRIALPAFDMRFTQLGWWRKNQVAWATTDETPRPLLDLVQQLQSGLAALGYAFEERRFQPHVTLLRKAHCPAGLIDCEPIAWNAREFVLVRSTLHKDGSQYAMVQRWPLQNLGASF